MPSKLGLHVISSADLERFASALFQAAGVARTMADEWAKSLVWANLRGVDSHGVLRIPIYLDRLKHKVMNPAPEMRVEKRAGAIDGGSDRAGARGPYRLVRGAQHYPCRRGRLFRAAGGECGNGRHRDVGVGSDDGLLRRQGRRRLDQSDRDCVSRQEPTAAFT